MKKHLLLLLSLTIAMYSYAQNASVKGIVSDTLNNQNLKNAVVSLLKPKDSVLYKFTRTNTDGSFEMKNLNPGKYVMMITYPHYVPFMEAVELKETETFHLPKVSLITEAKLLEEVIVKHTVAPIRMKGDTLEFIADSFKVKEGASVEDLLKKFPGFTVNSKGEITAQGQRIEKVLVDGDEFFGDDPTMATQNLNAKDVAKVQMFDKKSDQATLTGIDDGQKKKTLNLILKDDAKKGYFGKAEAGTDFNKYYQAKGTFNRFTSTLKTGAYVTADNTGRNYMSWNELQDFGGMTTTITDDGGVYVNFNGDGFGGSQGIPENLQTAAMFNKKFGPLKNSTNNNYSYKRQLNAGDATTKTKYILPDTVYFYNQSQHFNNSKWQHALNTKNEFNLDSSSTINVNANGIWGHSTESSIFHSEYLTGKEEMVNASNRTNNTTTDRNSQKIDLFYKKKLNKAGTRSFTINGGFFNNENNSNGYLYNKIDYYKSGSINNSQIVDQKKTNYNKAETWQGLVSYTEPLSKKLSLNLNYTFSFNNSNQDVRSYEKGTGNYDSLNPIYSNHYQFINNSNKGGFLFNYATKKITIKAGSAIQDLNMKQTNLYKDSSFERSFTNFFPQMEFNWKYSAAGNIGLYYSGNTRTPSLNQIQPIANNTDPLNIAIGNPELKPSFTHNFNFYYRNVKTLDNRFLSTRINFSTTQNAFSNKDFVDSLGRRIYQTVNVNGNYNFNMYFGYSRKLKFLALESDIGPSLNSSRNINYVNSIENTTNTYGYGIRMALYKFIEKKLSFGLTYNPYYNHSQSSVNTSTPTNYWTHNIYNFINYTPIKGFTINSNVDANYRQKISENDNGVNTFVWDMSVEKKILKKNDLWLSASVNDILNQRIGFNRSITSNFISENTYTTVQRYFLLTLRWKFSKNRKPSEDD